MKMATDQLSMVFSALADPTRRAILERLSTGSFTVYELAEPFDMTVQGVSQHLKTLERAGLVARGKRAQTRPAELAPDGLRAADQWLGRYRHYWESSFSRLDEHLARLQRPRSAAASEPEAGPA
jgi:DNA-binding transcriptional ArsR family regulator